MHTHQPLWLRSLNWMVILLTIVWVVQDRIWARIGTMPLHVSAAPLYEWLLVLAAMALFAGLIHIVRFHFLRVWRAQREWGYSLACLITCTIVITFSLSEPGTDSTELNWVYAHIIAPGEAALMATTLFLLSGTFMMMLRTRRRGTGWLTAGLLAVLVLQMPWIHSLLPSDLAPTLDNLMHLIVVPVSRGLLLGSGILITAVVIQFLLGDGEYRTTPS